MWTNLLTVLTLTVCVLGDQVKPMKTNIVTEGVVSTGFNVVYGDQDMTIINEVINNVEKKSMLKKKHDYEEAIKPLDTQDVKCLMSVDRYCSKDMLNTKRILVWAVKEDCAQCTSEEKNKAGSVIASMMTHDPMAWKLFLTRSALETMKSEDPKERKLEPLKFRNVGEPEEVVRSPHNMFIRPGAKVRVKRYTAEIVP